MKTEIVYSDGDIESEILTTLKEATDLSSTAKIAFEKQKTNWAFEYHLSPTRANIVRHFDFRGKKVLEVGAGMGAVSRFVSEKCDFLQIVEGTSRRLNCLKERLRDRKNFDVFCGNFKDFTISMKFDFVLIIGVLEYSELYFACEPSEDPFVEFLSKAKSFLAPGGKVVVAIENRLGLKYWAGASEDHTGNFFDGIIGYSQKKSVRTFSKKELNDLFDKAGLNKTEMYFPFPDYKMPKVILSEKMESLNPELFSELAGQNMARDYSRNRIFLFPDSLAFRSLAKTGLVSEFANSFLMIGSLEPTSEKKLSGTIGFVYTQDRKYNCITEFIADNSEIRVRKSLLNSTLCNYQLPEIEWSAGKDEAIASGEILQSKIIRLITFREWETLDTLWTYFGQWIKSEYGAGEGLLQGRAWDFIPQNIVVSKNNCFIPIDKEWVLRRSFEMSWYVIRVIQSLDNNILSIIADKYGAVVAYMAHLCNLWGLVFNLERDLQNELKVKYSINDISDISGLQEEYANILAFFSEKDHAVASDVRSKLDRLVRPRVAEQQLNDLRNSTSWSITKPIRILGDCVRRILQIKSDLVPKD